MNTDPYGIANYTGGAGIYTSLAGGAVPSTSTYSTAAANSNNGVNWGGIISGVNSLATTGANIYSSIANGSRKAGDTNVTFLNPNTGLPNPVDPNPTYRAAGNNNVLFIIAGVVLIVVIGFFAFFKKGK